MTQKEFTENCERIMALTELTLGQKELLIKNEASRFTDRAAERTPEVRDFWKRYEAMEKRLAGHNGFSHCPHDGEWSPERPTEIKALDQEYDAIVRRMADKTFQEVWAGVTA